ncbi:MAG: T9SS type A sorting domain-containing protein [Saprospiraceae bacterium]|nr:T9SS type A sorting domain-containing protein [Saprospiraceae bacterium]
MRKILFLIILVILGISVQDCYSQSITYTYDATGNMIVRSVIALRKQNPNQLGIDSTNITQLSIGESTVVIYPNQTKGQLRIEISNIKEDAKVELLVYDVSGKLVISEKKIGSSNILDLSDKPLGIYFMKLKVNKKDTEWKIVKD